MLKLELIISGQVQRSDYHHEVANFIYEHFPQTLGKMETTPDGNLLVIACAPLEDLKKIRDYIINQAKQGKIRQTKEAILAYDPIKEPYSIFSIET